MHVHKDNNYLFTRMKQLPKPQFNSLHLSYNSST